MADPIHGKYCLLSMWVVDQYYPVLCGTDTTYTCTPEMIERTGPESGPARQWFRRIEDHRSTVSGLSLVENDVSLTFFYMLQIGIRRETQLFKQTFADVDGAYKELTGYALIGTQSINGPVSDFSNSSIEIYWDGEPTLESIANPSGENVYALYIDCVEGETSVHATALEAAGVTILEVARTGTGHDETSGTPGNREFKFGGVGVGTISFDVTNPFNADEVIYVLYKV